VAYEKAIAYSGEFDLVPETALGILQVQMEFHLAPGHTLCEL
jgi:hypothetical protein